MLVRAEKPLVLVIALGIFGIDPLELLRAARAEQPALPIFLIGDRDGELPDEDTAARVGATRLFLRPIDVDALADAIEKRAVEAEVAEDVAEAMAEFDVRPADHRRRRRSSRSRSSRWRPTSATTARRRRRRWPRSRSSACRPR